MKPNQRRSLSSMRSNATVIADGQRGIKMKNGDRGQVPKRGEVSHQRLFARLTPAEGQSKGQKPKNLWQTTGKVLLAVLGLGMTVAGLTFTYADSHLTIVGGMQPEIRGHLSSGKTFTFLCVVYCTVRNAGFKSDFIEHIDIQPTDLDDTIKSEPKFTDREIVGWRGMKTLRFEVLISAAIGSGEKRFQMVLYDSKGRQVGLVPIVATFPEPSVPVLLNFVPPVDSLVSPEKPLPTLVSMTLSGSVPEIKRNPQRRYFVTFTTIEGRIVAQSDPRGRLERDGSIELPINFLSAGVEPFPVQCHVWTDPPREPWLAFQMKWTSVWSDGTQVLNVMTPPEPKASEPSSRSHS
jgi:hypothetical protein